MFCFLARRPASSLFSEVSQRITFSILLAFLSSERRIDLSPFTSISFNFARLPDTVSWDSFLVNNKMILSSSGTAPFSMMMSTNFGVLEKKILELLEFSLLECNLYLSFYLWSWSFCRRWNLSISTCVRSCSIFRR